MSRTPQQKLFSDKGRATSEVLMFSALTTYWVSRGISSAARLLENYDKNPSDLQNMKAIVGARASSTGFQIEAGILLAFLAAPAILRLVQAFKKSNAEKSEVAGGAEAAPAAGADAPLVGGGLSHTVDNTPNDKSKLFTALYTSAYILAVGSATTASFVPGLGANHRYWLDAAKNIFLAAGASLQLTNAFVDSSNAKNKTDAPRTDPQETAANKTRTNTVMLAVAALPTLGTLVLTAYNYLKQTALNATSRPAEDVGAIVTALATVGVAITAVRMAQARFAMQDSDDVVTSQAALEV
jgi:hypothetical protein